MPPRSPACGLWPGSAASWWYAARKLVTLQLSGDMLLVCLGLLLGSTWTVQALQYRLRRRDEERRRVNDEWLALHPVLRQRSQCPHCGAPPSEWRDQPGSDQQ